MSLSGHFKFDKFYQYGNVFQSLPEDVSDNDEEQEPPLSTQQENMISRLKLAKQTVDIRDMSLGFGGLVAEFARVLFSQLAEELDQ